MYFFNEIYKKQGKVWTEAEFWLKFGALLKTYNNSPIFNKRAFFDQYLYKKFGQKKTESYEFTLELMTSYQRYFSYTLECRVLTSLLSKSQQESKEALTFYLKSRSLVEKILYSTNGNRVQLSADKCYLTKSEVLDYITRLLKDANMSKRIWGWLKQEEVFLKEVNYYKLDTSGLAENLQVFFKDDGSLVGISYLLEFLFKNYLPGNGRLVIELCSRLNIKNISMFIDNLDKFKTSQKLHPEDSYYYQGQGLMNNNNFKDKLKAKEMCMNILKMKKITRQKKLAIGKMLGLMEVADEILGEYVEKVTNARNDLNTLKKSYDGGKYEIIEVPIFGTPNQSFLQVPTETQVTNTKSTSSWPQSPSRKKNYLVTLKNQDEVQDSLDTDEDRRARVLFLRLSRAFDNQPHLDIMAHKEAQLRQQQNHRLVIRDTKAIKAVYEKRIENIRDIVGKSIFQNRKIFARGSANHESLLDHTIYSFNQDECCEKCGGEKENYFTRGKQLCDDKGQSPERSKEKDNSGMSFGDSDEYTPRSHDLDCPKSPDRGDISDAPNEDEPEEPEPQAQEEPTVIREVEDEPIIIEKIVKRYVEVPVEKIVETIKEVPVLKIVEVPIKKIIERIKEVPVERIIEVPIERIKEIIVEKYEEKIVEVEVEVEKIVEKIKYVEVEIKVPREIIKEVEVIKEVKKRIEVEKIVEVVVEKIVEVTKEVEKIVEKIVEVHVEKIVERIVEVPKEVIVEVEVERIIEKIKEVPIEEENKSQHDICLSPMPEPDQPSSINMNTQTELVDPFKLTEGPDFDKDAGLNVLSDLFNNLISNDKDNVENWLLEQMKKLPDIEEDMMSKVRVETTEPNVHTAESNEQLEQPQRHSSLKGSEKKVTVPPLNVNKGESPMRKTETESSGQETEKKLPGFSRQEMTEDPGWGGETNTGVKADVSDVGPDKKPPPKQDVKVGKLDSNRFGAFGGKKDERPPLEKARSKARVTRESSFGQ